MLLEGYLYKISTNAGAHLKSTTSTLQGSTLLLYLKAASLWLHSKLHLDMPVVCPTTQKIVQPFRDTIAQAFKWGMPQPKQEPYTHQMIVTFYHQAKTLIQSDPQNNLSHFLVVFNWIRLGLFTGSRGAKYCQTSTRRHAVSRVPNDGIAGSHASEPLAFIMTDFRFLTSNKTLVTPLDGLAHPLRVVELQICF